MSFSNSKIKQVVAITITLIFSYWLIGYPLYVQAYFEDSFIDQMMDNYIDNYVDQIVEQMENQAINQMIDNYVDPIVEQMENQAIDMIIDSMISGIEDRAIDGVSNTMTSETERYYYWVQKPNGELKKIRAIKSNTEEKASAYAKKKGWSFLIGQYDSYPEKPMSLQSQSIVTQTERYYYWVQKPNGELKKIKAIKSNTEEKASAYAKKKGWSFLIGQYGAYPKKPVQGINKITRVIDGDTFDVLLADGSEDRIRLLGVDTPETYLDNEANEYDAITDTACLDEWGDKATQYAKDMLEGEEISLSYDSIAGKRGDYDRLLAYVKINSQDFGTLLLENGYARVYTESDFEKEDYYVSLQQETESNKIGLWSCKKEESSPYDNPCIVYCEDKCFKKHSFTSPNYMICFVGCLEICNIRNEIPF